VRGCECELVVATPGVVAMVVVDCGRPGWVIRAGGSRWVSIKSHHDSVLPHQHRRSPQQDSILPQHDSILPTKTKIAPARLDFAPARLDSSHQNENRPSKTRSNVTQNQRLDVDPIVTEGRNATVRLHRLHRATVWVSEQCAGACSNHGKRRREQVCVGVSLRPFRM
jgi:hypothetical protein